MSAPVEIERSPIRCYAHPVSHPATHARVVKRDCECVSAYYVGECCYPEDLATGAVVTWCWLHGGEADATVTIRPVNEADLPDAGATVLHRVTFGSGGAWQGRAGPFRAWEMGADGAGRWLR